MMIQDEISFFKCVKGLPEGTKFIKLSNQDIFEIFIIVSHESFPELHSEDPIPEFEPRIFNDLTHILPEMELEL